MKKSRRTYNGVHLNKKSNTQDVVEQSLTVFMVNADNKKNAVKYVLVLLYAGFILICIIGIPQRLNVFSLIAAAFKYKVLSNGHAELVYVLVCSPVGIRYILFLFPY